MVRGEGGGERGEREGGGEREREGKRIFWGGGVGWEGVGVGGIALILSEQPNEAHR